MMVAVSQTILVMLYFLGKGFWFLFFSKRHIYLIVSVILIGHIYIGHSYMFLFLFKVTAVNLFTLHYRYYRYIQIFYIFGV